MTQDILTYPEVGLQLLVPVLVQAVDILLEVGCTDGPLGGLGVVK